jgi:hypothetical protein
MAGGTKPKRRRQVWERLNPLTVAINAATLLTASEREQLLAPPLAAMQALRTGQCTETGWLHLVTCGHVALCIEEQGIVRGLKAELAESDQALVHIVERATASGVWKAPTCYGHELAAVSTMLTLHAFQIGKLSAKEYRNAVALAKARHLTQGGKVGKAA